MDWLFQYADPTIDWSFAMITLIVRFIGVFVVMFVMQVALQTSAAAVRSMERRDREKAAAAAPITSEAIVATAKEAKPDGLEPATVAAIGLALALEARPPVRPATASTASSWAMAGRIRQLQRTPR